MTKILIIEDENSVRDLLSDILETEGFDVAAAPDGQEGIELAQQYCPDLILCDIMMPAMSGYDVLSQVRTLPNLASVPFIFLTAKVNRGDQRQGMDMGADDYLTKPFTRLELISAIRARLQQRETVGKQYQRQLEDLRRNIAQALPHELLTPMNGLIGLSDLLKNNYDDIETTDLKDIAEGLYSSARRLERVIQNTLLYAKLQLLLQGQAQDPEFTTGICWNTEFAITWMAQQAARGFNRDTDLQFSLENTCVAISEIHLSKILEELVSNACKFSEPGTPIVIQSQVQGDRLLLAITDQGRGMTPDQIAQVGAYQQFERTFYEQQGTGLGLVIVRQLLQLYGGDLTISSIPKTSTTATLTLAIAPAESLAEFSEDYST